MSRAEERVPVRQRILEVASEMFYREGVRAVGIDAIIARSGVAKMSLYRNFPSKDALVTAWLEDRNAFFWGRWERAEASRAGNPRGQLEALLDMVAATVSHPKWRGCPFLNTGTEFPEPDHPARAVILANKRAVRERLQKEDLTGQLRIPMQSLAVSAPQSAGLQSAPGFFSREPGSRTVLPFPSSPSGLGKENHYPRASAPIEPPSVQPHDKNETAVHPSPKIGPEAKSPASSDFKVLQLYDAYLVVETPEGMLVIDQHALHERILFEQMLTRLEQNGQAPSQRLLLPETVELSARDAHFLREQLPLLTRLGVGLGEFGERTFLLDALPPFVKASDPRRFVLELVDELKAAGQEVNLARLGEHTVAKTVCRHAVKANDPLAGPELENLVEDLRHCAMPYTCPHGRPTLIEMNFRELEKKFGRSQ